MSSFRTLLCTRADTRLSNLRSLLSSSRPLKASIRATSACLRFNSSVSSSPAQDALSASTPAVDTAEDLSGHNDSASPSASDPTDGHQLQLRQLSNKVFEGATNLQLRQSQTTRLGKPIKPRSMRLAVKGGLGKVMKDWTLNLTGDKVKLEDGFIRVGTQSVPNVWLRDNCQCRCCVHEETKQRLLDTFSIPEDISIKSAGEFETYIDVMWSDGHRSSYDKDFLKEAAAHGRRRAAVRQGHSESIVTWGSQIAEKPPQDIYREPGTAMARGSNQKTDDDLILYVLRKIRRFGFCYVQKVPQTPQATEDLLKRIAFIRETHYGAFYDFTADLAKADTAYTNIALPAHTDNTYFSDPAGLQAFHLLSHTDGSGGASLLVDGFKAAETLREEDKDAYRVLSTVNVHAHASGNAGISIVPYRGFPVLEHDTETGALLRVRWNVSDRAGVEGPLAEVGMWYAAARKFDAILKRKESEYWEQLQPGTVLVFDNWRVLHGRSAFTGKRRLCGGYVNRDDWISRYKMLHFGKKEVLGRLASG